MLQGHNGHFTELHNLLGWQLCTFSELIFTIVHDSIH